MIQKRRTIFAQKYIKITKREHAFKDYASIYNVVILNSFNPELQLKDTKAAIKSKLIQLLTQLQGFKFVTTLFLMLKKTESEDKKNMIIFIQVEKLKYSWSKESALFCF